MPCFLLFDIDLEGSYSNCIRDHILHKNLCKSRDNYRIYHADLFGRLVWFYRNSLYTYRSNFSALSRRRRSLGLLALATCANADRSKKRAARRARWHEHPGCVRFSHKGLQARAAKSSLARPFMARSYVPSYFCYTTLEVQ